MALWSGVCFTDEIVSIIQAPVRNQAEWCEMMDVLIFTKAQKYLPLGPPPYGEENHM